MNKQEAIAVLEKEASIIDDNSIEMTAREWDEFEEGRYPRGNRSTIG